MAGMENYEELELIGKGSYGKVFKVRSRLDGELYVLKKVAFDGTAASEAEASLREAHVLSLLRHPHIVPYKEFFKHNDGDLCLVMAYCEGGDMFRYIKHLRKAGRHMDEEQAWQWLVQLLLALSYCHSKKILHRDVKTQNIFLSEGKVMLGDFGLAKQLQRTLEMARTPIGTPYYMAPEIYEEQPYSFKSDVWALGCVMYEMLMGKPAFAADNLSRVVIRVIRGNYDPLSDHFSEELRDVIGLMLCKTVKKRPEVNELLQHHSVVKHVQAYLDSLSAAGPSGWSTWRMKLPPSMLAQMANVIAQSRASQEAAAALAAASPAKTQSAEVNNAAVPQAVAHVHVQQPGPSALLPQQLEDVMSGTQLIEGFSLQSLLQDVPMAEDPIHAPMPVAQQMLISTLHPDDLARLQPPTAGAGAGGIPVNASYQEGLEHQLLSHQFAGISSHAYQNMTDMEQQHWGIAQQQQAGAQLGTSIRNPQQAAVHGGSIRGNWGLAGGAAAPPNLRSIRTTDSSGIDPGVSGDWAAQLAGGLPSAGFGFGAVAGASPPTPVWMPAPGTPSAASGSPVALRVVKRYDSRASESSQEDRNSAGHQGDAGAGAAVQLESVQEEGGSAGGSPAHAASPVHMGTGSTAGGLSDMGTPEHGVPPAFASPDRAGSLGGADSSHGMAPRPGRLPPLQHGGVQRLGSASNEPPAGTPSGPGSFSFASISSMPSVPTPVYEPRAATPLAPSPSQKQRQAILEVKGDQYEHLHDGVEQMVLSMGQISLHDTLLNRAARLRTDLAAQLGVRALADACAVVRDAQARISARGYGGGGGGGGGGAVACAGDVDMMGGSGIMDTGALHDDLAQVLGWEAVEGDAGADLMAWIDELVFLESRQVQMQAAHAWA